MPRGTLASKAGLPLLALVASAVPELAALPAPEQHFGHVLGADRTLLEWSAVVEYFRLLDDASDAIQVEELGRSTEGRPLILATIAAPETLARIKHYRQVLNKLADPRATTPQEALA
ncbi:MAG: hypothetical protein OXD30_03215, partial [Bryobacterales bacterium]|nr:hypothetical protein [Bryobacterales bacterium]